MKRILVGISGASGAILGVEILRELKKIDDVETHLIVTKGAEVTIAEETELSLDDVKSLSDYVYDTDNFSAKIASGSFEVCGMIVAPCSMKTLSAIANGYGENLLIRAADVALKEDRPLILLTRETPLSKIHLKNMLLATEAGATIIPPMLTFYNHPKTIEDMVNHIVGKTLLKFGIRTKDFKEYKQKNTL